MLSKSRVVKSCIQLIEEIPWENCVLVCPISLPINLLLLGGGRASTERCSLFNPHCAHFCCCSEEKCDVFDFFICFTPKLLRWK